MANTEPHLIDEQALKIGMKEIDDAAKSVVKQLEDYVHVKTASNKLVDTHNALMRLTTAMIKKLRKLDEKHTTYVRYINLLNDLYKTQRQRMERMMQLIHVLATIHGDSSVHHSNYVQQELGAMRQQLPGSDELAQSIDQFLQSEMNYRSGHHAAPAHNARINVANARHNSKPHNARPHNAKPRNARPNNPRPNNAKPRNNSAPKPNFKRFE